VTAVGVERVTMNTVTVPQFVIDAKRSQNLGIRFGPRTFVKLKEQTYGAVATVSELLDKNMADSAIFILDNAGPSVAQLLALMLGTLRDNQGLVSKLNVLLEKRQDWGFEKAVMTSFERGLDRLLACDGVDVAGGEAGR
jgi:hypothetical protein